MRKKDPWKGREIAVGVTGGIAAYKSAEIVSQLVQRGAGVTVVMTKEATHFVGPLTFQALTQRRVLLDPFDLETVVDPTHVTLTDRAETVLIAPATANILAKIAHGIGDDMLSSLMLAVSCPVVIAPAMNDRMWKNPVVQENLAKVKKLGHAVVDPEVGFLAERRHAIGRLASLETILSALESALAGK